MHLNCAWFGLEAAAKISLYCESVERRASQGRYPVILQLLESSMWKQQQLGDTEWCKHWSGKIPVITRAHMHGGSFTIQLQKGSKRSKAHSWSALPLQWCGRKAGWTDSQNICKLWRTLLLNIATQRKPGATSKPELVNSGATFFHLNRTRRSWYRALNKHIFKWVASKIFLSYAAWWCVWAQLGIDPKSGSEPVLGQYSLVMFHFLPLSLPSVMRR